MTFYPHRLIQEFIAPSRIPRRNDVLMRPLVIVEFDKEALKPHVVS